MGGAPSDEAAGRVHAHRKDGGPAADVVVEPGPHDFAEHPGGQPRHGHQPTPARAAYPRVLVSPRVAPRALATRANRPVSQSADHRSASGRPVVATTARRHPAGGSLSKSTKWAASPTYGLPHEDRGTGNSVMYTSHLVEVGTVRSTVMLWPTALSKFSPSILCGVHAGKTVG